MLELGWLRQWSGIPDSSVNGRRQRDQVPLFQTEDQRHLHRPLPHGFSKLVELLTIASTSFSRSAI